MNIYIWAAKIEDYSAMRGPCPEGYHIPSNYEWNNLCSTLTTSLGLAANRTTMRQYLKMPPAGYRRQNDGGVVSQGSRGDYRSCTVLSNAQASFMQFTSSSITPETASNKATWISIRWFKNSAVVPDSSWTTLYDWSSVAAWAWIYHNATLWLISISWDGKKWYTIQDKNLWATVVYNSWDTLSETNCGYYYQRWNNYWFAFTWTLTTSSTRVNASSYWPWNYYSSSTFITWSASWDTSNNPNLWWWQNRTPSQLKNVYIGEYKWAIQIFDFQNAWSLSWVWRSVGYWTPAYTSWQWWYIGTSSSSSYQWDITPTNMIFKGELRKIKIYFSRPQSTTSSRGSAVGITTTDGATGIEYGRFGSTSWRLNVKYSSTDHWIQTQELTWELIMEIIMENNWNVTVNLIDSSSNIYSYDWGQCAQQFKSARDSWTLELEVARWSSTTNYIRKVEITTF